MIAYMEGRLLKKDSDRILLLANQVGYEIMGPIFLALSTSRTKAGTMIS